MVSSTTLFWDTRCRGAGARSCPAGAPLNIPAKLPGFIGRLHRKFGVLGKWHSRQPGARRGSPPNAAGRLEARVTDTAGSHPPPAVPGRKSLLPGRRGSAVPALIGVGLAFLQRLNPFVVVGVGWIHGVKMPANLPGCPGRGYAIYRGSASCTTVLKSFPSLTWEPDSTTNSPLTYCDSTCTSVPARIR